MLYGKNTQWADDPTVQFWALTEAASCAQMETVQTEGLRTAFICSLMTVNMEDGTQKNAGFIFNGGEHTEK